MNETPPPTNTGKPAAPVPYRSPGIVDPQVGDLGAPQAVFDTVAGPNLRLRDNLIQLGCVAGGFGLGAAIGVVASIIWVFDRMAGLFLGGIAGAVLALFISGAVLGLVRGMRAVRRKK